MDAARRAALAVQRCGTLHAPDDRVACFDLDVVRNPLTLTGTVSTPELRRRALDALREAASEPVDVDVTVLSRHATPATCSAGVAGVRDAPSTNAERVTELRYGCAVTAFDATDDWRRVRAPDGYLGWVRADALVAPVDLDADATTTDELLVDGTTVPRGIECEIVDAERVRFRTGVVVQTDSVSRVPELIGESIVATAREYLGTAYRWGGTTRDGIDCSGLVWTTFRRHGVTLTRDADQQRAVGDPVARGDLQAGDLLFFPGHVAISTGGVSFVHAYGPAGEVVENSLDPAAGDYVADLDESFEGARRLC